MRRQSRPPQAVINLRQSFAAQNGTLPKLQKAAEERDHAAARHVARRFRLLLCVRGGRWRGTKTKILRFLCLVAVESLQAQLNTVQLPATLRSTPLRTHKDGALLRAHLRSRSSTMKCAAQRLRMRGHIVACVASQDGSTLPFSHAMHMTRLRIGRAGALAQGALGMEAQGLPSVVAELSDCWAYLLYRMVATARHSGILSTDAFRTSAFTAAIRSFVTRNQLRSW